MSHIITIFVPGLGFQVLSKMFKIICIRVGAVVVKRRLLFYYMHLLNSIKNTTFAALNRI